jgi:hypothetical protein
MRISTKPELKKLVLPRFLIVGAMRSGTTTLFDQLRASPTVFMPPTKELHFFDRHFDRGINWYSQQFEGARADQGIGEATPSYLGDARVPPRMAATLPSAKLIAMLRDPIERAYSHYWMNRARGVEPRSFDSAIEDELSGKLTAVSEGHVYDYIGRGRYLEHLLKLCEFYERSQLLVLLLDDMRADPSGTYESVCSFLGVDCRFVPPRLGGTVNAFVQFRSTRLRRLGKPLPRPLGSALARLNIRRGHYPPLKAESRGRLQAVFRVANLGLSEWLQRDLSMWN